MKNNLFLLLVKLFTTDILDVNNNKDIIEYLKKNENKLDPIAKYCFEQFLKENQLTF